MSKKKFSLINFNRQVYFDAVSLMYQDAGTTTQIFIDSGNTTEVGIRYLQKQKNWDYIVIYCERSVFDIEWTEDCDN